MKIYATALALAAFALPAAAQVSAPAGAAEQSSPVQAPANGTSDRNTAAPSGAQTATPGSVANGNLGSSATIGTTLPQTGLAGGPSQSGTAVPGR